MKDLLRSTFRPLCEWMTERASWLLLLAGFALVLATFAVRQGGIRLETVLDILAATGTALLSGGLFAWLTKTAQLKGVFRRDLEGVIYSERHALVRKDVDKLWVAVTRALHNDAFREIEEKIYEAIRLTYLPTNKDFYYRRVERDVEVELVDPDKQVIEVTILFQAILVPDRSKVGLVRPYAFQSGVQGRGIEAPRVTCRHCRIVGGQVINEADAVVDPNNPGTLTCRLPITVQEPVRIKDSIKFRQILPRDNLLMWRAISYVDGFRIRVQNLSPDKLLIQHGPLGTLELVEERILSNTTTISTDDLIFAGQGVILSFQAIA